MTFEEIKAWLEMWEKWFSKEAAMYLDRLAEDNSEANNRMYSYYSHQRIAMLVLILSLEDKEKEKKEGLELTIKYIDAHGGLK